MKKVGIITFHNAHNYGAILQSLSLQEKLRNLGYDVSIIDYKNQFIIDQYKYFSISQFLSKNLFHKLTYLFVHFLFIHKVIKRYILFKRFIKKNLLLKPYPINNDFCSYDCLIFGSDQIWNNKLTGYDTVYWGNVKCNRKISYAASVGKIDETIIESYKYLSNFDSIGVRENSLVLTLTKKGLNPVLNVDPTLLLTAKEWDTTLTTTQNSSSKYILVYSMRDRTTCIDMAKRYSEKLTSPVIEIPSGIDTKQIHNPHLYTGPKEFVELIKNASLVITDSFHGTVFSIIYSKPLLSIRQNCGGNERIESLMTVLHISQNFVLPLFDDEVPVINYEEVNIALATLRKDSLNYLTSNI